MPMLLIRCITTILVVTLTTQCKKQQKKTTTAIENTTTMETKFKWLPSECAPKHYAAEIYQGDFITEDNEYYGIPKGGTIKNGWGNIGSTWVVGPEIKAVPVRLKIIWISYTEDQFYYGDFKLPKQKMTELFEEGFIDARLKKKDTYDNIVVGLAPGGAVSVWLLGAGKTVEIGHYQAKKTDVSMADFNPSGIQNREKYIQDEIENFSEETKAVIVKEGVPIGKWTKYTQRYSWMPIITHEDDFTLQRFINNFYNGEFYGELPDGEIFKKNINYPPPKSSIIKWFNNKNVKFGCKIYFDEAEIWKAFETLYSKPETKSATLHYKIKAFNSGVSIFLASEKDTIEIKKASVKIYESSK